MSETLKRHSRVTGAERVRLASDLKARYEAGENIQVLAASVGRSHGAVVSLLHEAGTQMRGPRGGIRGQMRGPRPRRNWPRASGLDPSVFVQAT